MKQSDCHLPQDRFCNKLGGNSVKLCNIQLKADTVSDAGCTVWPPEIIESQECAMILQVATAKAIAFFSSNADYLPTLNIFQMDAPESLIYLGIAAFRLYLTSSHPATKPPVSRLHD
jgi:hypothetical protein